MFVIIIAMPSIPWLDSFLAFGNNQLRCESRDSSNQYSVLSQWFVFSSHSLWFWGCISPIFYWIPMIHHTFAVTDMESAHVHQLYIVLCKLFLKCNCTIKKKKKSQMNYVMLFIIMYYQSLAIWIKFWLNYTIFPQSYLVLYLWIQIVRSG